MRFAKVAVLSAPAWSAKLSSNTSEKETVLLPMAGGRFLGNTTMRDIVTLACTECKQRNYTTTKNKKNTPDKLEFSKYCRFCRKHTPHRETK